MNRTTAHILASIAWLFAPPLVLVALVLANSFELTSMNSLGACAVWLFGFVVIFASWSLRDAPAHGKSRSLALAFSAAWLLLAFVAVFPYLFATRGAIAGTLASLKFLSLCLAFGIAWLAFPRVFSLFQ